MDNDYKKMLERIEMNKSKKEKEADAELFLKACFGFTILAVGFIGWIDWIFTLGKMGL